MKVNPWILAVVASASFVVLAGLAQARQAMALAKKPAKKPAPAKKGPMAPIKDVEGLPRVLLIGDSISIGYTLDTRKLLAGKVNVHRIPTNGGPTSRGLESLDEWLGKGKWDVIHFNWGLHDLKYMGPKGGNLADPEAPTSKQQIRGNWSSGSRRPVPNSSGRPPRPSLPAPVGGLRAMPPGTTRLP